LTLSRHIWSLDHPIEIEAGMTFALETQHGKRFRYGVRIEEMLHSSRFGSFSRRV
jgi:Xaa-Pro aminopeptidase